VGPNDEEKMIAIALEMFQSSVRINVGPNFKCEYIYLFLYIRFNPP